jgi:hypothetical protein
LTDFSNAYIRLIGEAFKSLGVFFPFGSSGRKVAAMGFEDQKQDSLKRFDSKSASVDFPI